MKKINLILLLAVVAFMASCDTPMPFGGPGYDYDGNLKKDRQIIADHLATTHYDSISRIHDPSGVVVIVQEEGTASRPISGNLVYTHYIGSLLDGSVFDTSYEEIAREHGLYIENRDYTPFAFSMDGGGQGAIPGFTAGFRNLRSGSKAILIIPSPLGYQGKDDNERIPPHSILVFEVDFLGMD